MKPTWNTAYSDAHRPLFEKHFLPSWKEQGMNNDFTLQVEEVEVGGHFGSKEFNEYGTRMMFNTLERIKKMEGQLIVFSGCDMRFYAPIADDILNRMAQAELVVLWDAIMMCGDFMAYVVTPRIIELYELMIATDRNYPNQQFTFNYALQHLKIACSILGNDYWTVGMSNKSTVWGLGQEVNPPENMKLHHANYTIGSENKMKLLDKALQNWLLIQEKIKQ